jgi:hypothetical protein
VSLFQPKNKNEKNSRLIGLSDENRDQFPAAGDAPSRARTRFPLHRDRAQVDMAIERVRARLSRETEPRVPRARAFPAMIRTSRFMGNPPTRADAGSDARADARRATRPRRGAPRVRARRRVLPRGRAYPAADSPARLTSPLPRARSPRVASRSRTGRDAIFLRPSALGNVETKHLRFFFRF